jgi:CMP-2-keto-3-deoxyoctulosonic acid synthetase
MAVKPTELRKVIAMLEGEAPDVETLAKDVFQAVEDMLNQRNRYVVFVVHPSLNLVQAVGPYDTAEKAKKDYVKRVGIYDRHTSIHLALLKHPDMIESD